MPAYPQKISLEERVRRYLLAMEAPRRDPADPQDSHTVVFNAARVLLHGFGFTPHEARPFFEEFLSRSDLPWTQAEITHKLRSVDAQPSRSEKGYLRRENDWKPSAQERKDFGIPTEAEVRKKVEFEIDKLKAIAAPWRDIVTGPWLANRSAVDPATVTAADFLRLMYPNGEKILCFENEYSQGDQMWPDEQPVTDGSYGIWFLPQPVCGEYRPNPEGKARADGGVPVSRRTWRCVTDFRYFVIESDSAPLRDWLGFIVQIPARIEALYTSGSRSVHALVRVDCPTKESWDEEKRRMMPFLMAGLMCGADRGTWSAVRLSRLPGCLRRGKLVEERDGDGNKTGQKKYMQFKPPGEQKLLYLRPNAPMRPICELAAVRNVEATWKDLARTCSLAGGDESVALVRRGLHFYTKGSEAIRTASDEMELRLTEEERTGW
ncbi:MAG: hypothetical protein K0R17_2752 [Rariglobus sp.]|jgi:hypothetical protein|nr:hypothetical protein [Rariglobus sp.]